MKHMGKLGLNQQMLENMEYTNMNKKQKHMKHIMGKCRLKQQISVNGFKMIQRAEQWM